MAWPGTQGVLAKEKEWSCHSCRQVGGGASQGQVFRWHKWAIGTSVN